MFVMQPFLYVCYALDTCGAKSYVPIIPFPSCRDLCLTTTTDTTPCYILLLLGMVDRLAIKPFTTIVFYSSTPVHYQGLVSAAIKSCLVPLTQELNNNDIILQSIMFSHLPLLQPYSLIFHNICSTPFSINL